MEANLEAKEAVVTQKKTKNTKEEKVLSALGLELGTPEMADTCANHYTNVSLIHIRLFNEYLNRLLLYLTAPDPPARLSEEERLFSKQKLQKLKMFARLEKVSLPMRHY